MQRVVGTLWLDGPAVDRGAFDGAVESLWYQVGRPCGWFPSASASGQRLEWNECSGDMESSLFYLHELCLQMFGPAGVSVRGTVCLLNSEGTCMRVDVHDTDFRCRYSVVGGREVVAVK